MTHEIRARERSVNSNGSKMINQYEFILKVGKGQHGEVYLARDTTKGNMDVVSFIWMPHSFSIISSPQPRIRVLRPSNAFPARTRATV